MKVVVEAVNSPSIYNFLGTTAELRIYADRDFLTFGGQVIPQGFPNLERGWYLTVGCEIQGSNVIYQPSFEFDSTTDGEPNNARYIALLFDQNGAYIGPWPWVQPSGFVVPAIASQTWLTLRAYNRGRSLMNAPATFPTTETVAAMIAAAVSQQLLRASETQVGNTALSEDPVDPAFPIAVGVTDPNYVALVASLANKGTTTLVDGAATVVNANVAAGSLFFLASRSSDVTGTLRVAPADIVAGASFVIRSSNIGDNGEVSWMFV